MNKRMNAPMLLKEACPAGKYRVNSYLRTTTNKVGEKHTSPVRSHCRSSPVKKTTLEENLDPEIESLHLEFNARKGAYLLKNKFPNIKFTSGRRSRSDQARAMASNVIKDPHYIAATHTNTKASRACQKWVDEHLVENKLLLSRNDIVHGLKEVLDTLSDEESEH